MKRFKLGDLVLFKTHPYIHKIHSIKISANALLTPPIMNIIEILYSDSSKSNISKVRGVFYNSNTNKFERIWFNYEELLLFKDGDDFIKNDFQHFSKYTLRSTLDELRKEKSIHQVDNGYNKSSSSSTLNHLPPIFLLLEEKEIMVEGNKKLKDFSEKGYKVKWFNPKTNSFSEDILPSCVLLKVSNDSDESLIINAIDNKYIYEYKLEKTIKDITNGLVISNSLFKVIDLRYNHYSIIIKIFDILLNKELEILIDEIKPILNSPSKLFSEYFFNKHPRLEEERFIYPYEFDFKIKHLYYITYVNNHGEKSVRCIIVYRKMEPNLKEENNDGQLIEAFCLLRNDIRYFWTKRIVQMFESNIRF